MPTHSHCRAETYIYFFLNRLQRPIQPVSTPLWVSTRSISTSSLLTSVQTHAKELLAEDFSFGRYYFSLSTQFSDFLCCYLLLEMANSRTTTTTDSSNSSSSTRATRNLSLRESNLITQTMRPSPMIQMLSKCFLRRHLPASSNTWSCSTT